MHVKVHIHKNNRLIPLGLIRESDLDLRHLHCYGTWRKALFSPVEELHPFNGESEPQQYPFAEFTLAGNRALVCTAGSLHLVNWYRFASFPEGRSLAS